MDALKAALMASLTPDSSEAVGALLSLLGGAELDVHICSWGGVGSTFLSNFLTTRANLSTNLLTDQDNLRHCPRPPSICQDGSSSSGSGSSTGVRRGVYLFGNPLESVASHFRRGHARHQATKTSGREPPEGPFVSFDAYARHGEDYFGLHDHLHNWLTLPLPYDVMFVRYENMFDSGTATALLDFALQDINMATDERRSLVDEFVSAHSPRRSQVDSTPAFPASCDMYRDLQAKVESLGPHFIRRRSVKGAEACHCY